MISETFASEVSRGRKPHQPQRVDLLDHPHFACARPLGHNIDERDFGDAAEILNSLKINSVILLSNNPEKLETLTSSGIKASLQILSGDINTFNEKYVATKKERLGHK